MSAEHGSLIVPVPINHPGAPLKTVKLLVTSALLISVSACSSGATQTGGGQSTADGSGAPTTEAAETTGAAETTEAVETTEAAEAVPMTVTDVVAEGWLAGTAEPEFDLGSDGNVDVVTSGPINSSPGGTKVPIAIRNNSGDTITGIDVTGAAKDAAGTIIGSGQSQGVNPANVPPGGIALGFVYYQSEIPADAAIDFTVASTPLEGEPYFRDLQMDQANLVGESITGQATNTSDDTINGPYGVSVYCFSEAGELLSTQGGYASPDADLGAGQSVTFEIPLFGAECPTFLVGASGYGPL
ncbi:hypothetical protein [Arthrobacter sp. TMN-50]